MLSEVDCKKCGEFMTHGHECKLEDAMSWGDCDFAGDGQAADGHGDCTKMGGHSEPHKDCNGREWTTKSPTVPLVDTPQGARQWLGNRGLADTGLYWPPSKPMPKIDYESGEAQPTLTALMEAYSKHVCAERDKEIARLKVELEVSEANLKGWHTASNAQMDRARLTSCSTIEAMLENPNVDSHVREWEKRCLTAEAELDERTREVEHWKSEAAAFHSSALALNEEVKRLTADAYNLKSPAHSICNENLTEALAAAIEATQRAASLEDTKD